MRISSNAGPNLKPFKNKLENVDGLIPFFKDNTQLGSVIVKIGAQRVE